MIRAGLLLLAVLGLSACSGGYAPVSERSIHSRPLPESGTYTVRSGDTLYSIAWRYNLDYRDLARLNRIDSRYLIYPGQTLRLKPATKAVTQSSSPSASVAPKVPAERNPVVTKPTPTAAQAKTAGTRTPDQASKTVAPAQKLEWRWPATGALLSSFSGSGSRGIDISGKAGDPVLAAGPGRVVYAGDGLRGYGNLVIINHNQEFLSAYAHNSRVFVKENDMVKSGEKIAEIGSSGAAREMLHFEIRRDGQPVDPLQYLPKR